MKKITDDVMVVEDVESIKKSMLCELEIFEHTCKLIGYNHTSHHILMALSSLREEQENSALDKIKPVFLH